MHVEFLTPRSLMSTILVVDDSPGDLAIVRRLLSKDESIQVQSARDGAEAVSALEAGSVDVIVTDLRMPNVDGLELVGRVRRSHPEVPVILMTAHGNEAVAVEALRHGAASYVPKLRLAERLLPTVREILALAQATRSHQRLNQCLTRTRMEFQLDNDPLLIPALVDHVQKQLAGVQLLDANGRLRIAVAMEEALTNAMYHGNLEIAREQMIQAAEGGPAPSLADLRRNQPPYADRRVHVFVDISTDRAQFIIRDEGPGFNLDSIPDPDEPENVERCQGRGLMLMQTLTDDLRFNEAGNEVTMEVQVIGADHDGKAQADTSSATALFRHAQRGDAVVVTPLRNIGSLAEYDVQREFAALRARIASDAVRHVVVDFSHLSYFGSSMLEGLRSLWAVLREHSGQLAVCCLSPVGAEILHLAQFDRLFLVRGTVDEALAAVNESE